MWGAQSNFRIVRSVTNQKLEHSASKKIYIDHGCIYKYIFTLISMRIFCSHIYIHIHTHKVAIHYNGTLKWL